MEKELFELREKILEEVIEYLDEYYYVDYDEMTPADNEELRENLKNFQSQSFIKFLEKTNLELMFNVFINEDNELEVEILDI